MMADLMDRICAISVARIALYQAMIQFGQLDFTYSVTVLYLFTAIEPALGITLACMPLMRPLFEHISPAAALTYIKSLIQASRSRTTREQSSGGGGYEKTVNVKGLGAETHGLQGK